MVRHSKHNVRGEGIRTFELSTNTWISESCGSDEGLIFINPLLVSGNCSTSFSMITIFLSTGATFDLITGGLLGLPSSRFATSLFRGVNLFGDFGVVKLFGDCVQAWISTCARFLPWSVSFANRTFRFFGVLGSARSGWTHGSDVGGGKRHPASGRASTPALTSVSVTSRNLHSAPKSPSARAPFEEGASSRFARSCAENELSRSITGERLKPDCMCRVE